MLLSILAIIDRLISLLEFQTKEKRYAFEKHLDPLFADLSLIHTDYRKVFGELANPTKPSDSSETLTVLIEAKRTSALLVREKVHELTRVFLECEKLIASQPAKEFLRSCASYLCTGGDTRFTSAIDRLSSDEMELDSEYAQAYFRSVLDGLERSWREVSKQYANLKASVI